MADKNKPQAKFDTVKAFEGMGSAVEVLMKAAPNVFTHATVSGKEQQGKPRNRGNHDKPQIKCQDKEAQSSRPGSAGDDERHLSEG